MSRHKLLSIGKQRRYSIFPLRCAYTRKVDTQKKYTKTVQELPHILDIKAITTKKEHHDLKSPGRILYLDYSCGMRANTLLALLSDLGLDITPLSQVFAKANITANFTCVRQQTPQGRGTCVKISKKTTWTPQHFSELHTIIPKLTFDRDLAPSHADHVRQRVIHTVHRLSEVEKHLHDIHCFPEMDPMDIFILVVSIFWGLAKLNIESVKGNAVPCPFGCNTTGNEFLFLPATEFLLQGKPVGPAQNDRARITPCGALIIDQVVQCFCNGPEGILERCGVGFDANLNHTLLRGVLTQKKREKEELESIWVLETHLDHLTGEEVGAALERIMQQGALDVLFIPGLMKKGRPGGLLRVLCAGELLEQVEQAIFHYTHTLGLRRRREERRILPREACTMQVAGKEVAAKQYTLNGAQYARAEYEALKSLANRTGRSLPDLRFLMEE